MATFAQIQTRVKTRVIDLPTAVTSEVDTLVNEAMKRLQKRHNYKVMETETAILTTTLATRTLSTAPVPSNMKELRGKPYLIHDNGQHTALLSPLSRTTVIQTYTVDDANAKGEPKLLLDSEPTDEGVRNWQVYPFPDGLSDYSDGEYRVVIPYWRYIPAMTDDADTNWFTTNAEEYLVKQATSEAFALDWDEERLAVWAQLAATEETDLKIENKRARLAGVTTFVPHFDVFDSKLRD